MKIILLPGLVFAVLLLVVGGSSSSVSSDSDDEEPPRDLLRVRDSFGQSTWRPWWTKSTTVVTDNSTCSIPSDCGFEKYCSDGQCRPFGQCGTDMDCLNPWNIYAARLCTGVVKCNDEGLCGTECGPPCPDGSNGQVCFVQPCRNAETNCEGQFAFCLNDYCNCQAIVFNLAGSYEICDGSSTPTCTSSKDCGEGSYCNSGHCLEYGQCKSNADCRNPENIYAESACVGPTTCSGGNCRKQCTGSVCADGVPEVRCFESPCSACNETYNVCTDDYCGGCNAIAFDLAGNQVCVADEDFSKGCSNTNDCEDGFYCAGGVCLEYGQCSKNSDCRNPNNIYAIAACVGFIFCDDSSICAIECGSSFCEDGSEQVECTVQPCNATSSDADCLGDFEYCIDDYCNGCNTILLDAAGNEVFCPSTQNATADGEYEWVECLNSTACPEDHYCGGGLCLANGECTKDSDCRNPNNLYAIAFCVGYIHCDDSGMCAIECGAPCPDGSNEVECFGQPCAVVDSNCMQDFEYCIDDYCHPCGTILLDAAGNEVVCASTQQDATPSESNGIPCANSTECPEDHYCGGGLCVANGQCNKDSDCRNPDNLYAVAACVGYIHCDNGGMCAIECVAACPDGSEEAQCDVQPCSVVDANCSEVYEFCIDDYCNGCGTILLDVAGNEVVCASTQQNAAWNASEGIICTNSTECPEDHYCGGDLCLANGECTKDSDCANPNNLYAIAFCVGYIYCDDSGMCAIECGAACRDGSNEVECFAQPCSVVDSDCMQDFEYCIDDYCNGCGTILLDAAGNEVVCASTQQDATPSESNGIQCANSTECPEDHYCGGGLCLANGQCNKDSDCRNPDNFYAVAACVGYIHCDNGGMCAIECGAACPDGSEEVQCDAQPCSVVDANCSDVYEFCIDDYCNGCGTILLDAAGNEVVCASTQENAAWNASEGIICTNSTECPEDHYCGGGVCLANGECNKDSDCRNPNNLYAIAMCVGYIHCDDRGMCAIECGAACPDGSEEVQCGAQPCSVVKPDCLEDFEYCIDDYCNGCRTILLDEAGNEVVCT